MKKFLLLMLVAAAGLLSAETFGEYVIKPGDELNIIVTPSDEINKEVVVQKDGKISLKLIGEIQAAGLTFKQLQDNIVKELSRYVTSPLVSVSLKEFGKSKVYVLGQVRGAGSYDFKEGMRFLEMISMCQGFTQDGDAANVKIFRSIKNSEKREIIEVNAEDLLDRGDFSKNVELKVDDIVYVPPKGLSVFNWFLSNIMPPLYLFSTLATIYLLVR